MVVRVVCLVPRGHTTGPLFGKGVPEVQVLPIILIVGPSRKFGLTPVFV